MARHRFRFTVRQLLLAVGIVCILLAIAISVTTASRQARERERCRRNLWMIGNALYTYQQINGCFPAPFIADANGKLMHSWRAAIHAQLISGGFALAYDFRQPWDSPSNLAVAAKYANPNGNHEPYACPCASNAQGRGLANYVMVVGPQTATRAGHWSTLNQITEASENAIIVAEIADSDILWTEPRDLSIDDMSFTINDKSKPSISSNHWHGAMVLMADGTIRFLDNATDPDELRSMLTLQFREATEIEDPG